METKKQILERVMPKEKYEEIPVRTLSDFSEETEMVENKNYNQALQDCKEALLNSDEIVVAMGEEKLIDILDTVIYRQFDMQNKSMSDDDIKELARTILKKQKEK